MQWNTSLAHFHLAYHQQRQPTKPHIRCCSPSWLKCHLSTANQSTARVHCMLVIGRSEPMLIANDWLLIRYRRCLTTDQQVPSQCWQQVLHMQPEPSLLDCTGWSNIPKHHPNKHTYNDTNAKTTNDIKMTKISAPYKQVCTSVRGFYLPVLVSYAGLEAVSPKEILVINAKCIYLFLIYNSETYFKSNSTAVNVMLHQNSSPQHPRSWIYQRC